MTLSSSEPRYDLVLRGGDVVDGTGAPRRRADVGIRNGVIVDVAPDLPPGQEEFDATGHVVTPGFVDVHTHYDAQVTWDPLVTPSSGHGVTTVVMGNCGVGFAPARPDAHEWLISLMEGVEDIPGTALTEGMKWSWEHFPEYLDSLDAMPRVVDIATQVPHAAVRAYVMGRRVSTHEAATDDELAAMQTIVRDGIAAGALGVSTSRTPIHKGMDGRHMPGTFADERELWALGRGVVEGGGGMLQMTGHHPEMEREFGWMERIAREVGVSVSFNLLQSDAAPDLWKTMLGHLERVNDAGLDIHAQIAGRPNGVLMTWGGTAVPFLPYPSYMPMHSLPLDEKLARLRAPGLRERLCAEKPFSIGEFEDFIIRSRHKVFRLGNPPNYEPHAEESAAAVAAAKGVDPNEVVFDWLMEDDGRGILYFPIFNYAANDCSVLHSLLSHPHTRLGLGDGGAHCGAICDASAPTFLLTFWTRDRARGPRLPLERVVQILTWDTASFYGLHDRGRLVPGARADVNVLDLDALHLHAPRMVWDLPAGGRRFLQDADGYRATFVAGQRTFDRGQPTGARPGRLVRGRRGSTAAT